MKDNNTPAQPVLVASTVRSRTDNTVGVLFRNHDTRIYEVHLFDKNNPKPVYSSEQDCFKDAKKALGAIIIY